MKVAAHVKEQSTSVCPAPSIIFIITVASRNVLQLITKTQPTNNADSVLNLESIAISVTVKQSARYVTRDMSYLKVNVYPILLLATRMSVE